jgi:hypothetical protein
MRRAATALLSAAAVLLGGAAAVADVGHAKYGAPGSIAGQIVEVGTGTGLMAIVTVRNRATGQTFTFETASDGTFQEDGLLPGDYDVCAYGGYPGADPYGYVSRCHGSPQWWYEHTMPTSRAVAVTVNPGTVTTTGVALHDAGAITGRLRDARTGRLLDFANVTVFQHGRPVVSWATDSVGGYDIDGLPPAGGRNGFLVCFWINQGYPVSQPTGWAPQCWRNRQWSRLGNYAPASGSSRVPVGANTASTGINASLLRGAGVSGVIRSAAAGHPVVQDSRVAVFRDGLNFGETRSNSRGHYRFRSLPAGRYVVCAAGGTLGSAPTTRFGARCWHNVFWNRHTAPSRAATVSATNGAIHGAINLNLPRL